MKIIKKLKDKSNLSASEQEIANFILSDPASAIRMTVREIASKTFTSTTSILRLTNKISQCGFGEFRLLLASEIEDEAVILNPSESLSDKIEKSSALLSIVHHSIIDSINKTKNLLDYEIIDDITKIILNSKIIDIYGRGVSHIVGSDFHYKLFRLGLSTQIYRGVEMQFLQANNSSPHHCAIIISQSGNTPEIIKIAEILAKKGTKIVTLTTSEENALLDYSDYPLFFDGLESHLRVGSITSRSSMQYVLDCLYFSTLNHNHEEFSKKLLKNYTPMSIFYSEHSKYKLADYHVHSNYSIDSTVTIENYCKKAIATNLKEICLTEHVDYDIKNKFTDNQTIDYQSYFNEIEQLKTKFKEDLIIKAGIEFGVQLHNLDKYHKDANNYPFDFIILATHAIDNQEFWLQQFQHGKTQKEYTTEYFNNLKAIVSCFDDYDVVAHFDFIRRYDLKGYYIDEEIELIIEDILKILIKKGKGIEINASSFQYGLEDYMPSIHIIRKYYELGGRIITYGSDSHSIDALGANYGTVIHMLKNIGFDKLCTYDKRIVRFHKI